MEGVILYIKIVHVFSQEDKKHYIIFTLLSYGESLNSTTALSVAFSSFCHFIVLLYNIACAPMYLYHNNIVLRFEWILYVKPICVSQFHYTSIYSL